MPASLMRLQASFLRLQASLMRLPASMPENLFSCFKVEGSSDAYEEARRLNASLNDEIASLRQLVKSSSLAASPSGEF
jgi:hypothetical protein